MTQSLHQAHTSGHTTVPAATSLRDKCQQFVEVAEIASSTVLAPSPLPGKSCIPSTPPSLEIDKIPMQEIDSSRAKKRQLLPLLNQR